MTEYTGAPRARILSTGSCLPEFVLDNEALSRMVDTSDEWIRTRTGISERRINTTTTNHEMACTAAERALKASGLDPLAIDLVLGSTVTNDNFSPALSCYVQAALGLRNAFAFDVNAGCSGFVYALDTASAFISASRPGTKPIKNVLIVCSETLSRITDYTDRSSCILFGDGAGAAIVTADDSHGLLASCIRTDGNGADAIIAKATVPVIDNGDGTVSNGDRSHLGGLTMNGREVYRFAVTAVPEAINGALAQCALGTGDIRYFILHQANMRIIQSTVERLGLDSERVPSNIARLGNTSSASIPILLDDLNREGKLTRGDKLIFAGFGAGLTYGVTVMEW